MYALSASGKVYVLAADALNQEMPAGAPRSTGSWSSWLLGKKKAIQYQELSSKETLGWTERYQSFLLSFREVSLSFFYRFTSIAAGENHLLALTNRGRAFAHPVNKEANRYGQLGFRSFEIPDPAAAILKTKPENLKVELLPKSVREAAGKTARMTPSSAVATDLSNIDDSTIHWCTHLYEIPVLKGVEVSQIAAGGRSSFVRSPTGRVLGWGANEYG